MKLSVIILLPLSFITFFSQKVYAQQSGIRYNSVVFDSIKIDKDIIYGNNISIGSGMLDFQDLIMDVYSPADDTVADRPLIILIHSGGFQTKVLNKRTVGARDDSTIVALANDWASRGYVVAAITHRYGWATFGTVDEVRKSFSEAMYRAIQDANTSVRYFKKQFVEDENKFSIDTSRIVMGGIGSGAYVALGAAYLDMAGESASPKLRDELGLPYINEAFLGDVEGRDTALFSSPNLPNYSSEFNLVFSIGGAIVDTNWIQTGDQPLIALHTENDPQVPYTSGFLRVPTYNGDLLNVSGGYDLVNRSMNLGNQAIFRDPTFSDALTMRALEYTSGKEGLYPFIRPLPEPGEVVECAEAPGTPFPRQAEHDPWNWWNEEIFINIWDNLLPNDALSGSFANCNEKAANLDMGIEKGRVYVDTIINYITPRIVRAFELPTSVRDRLTLNANIKLYPNPSINQSFVIVSEKPNDFIESLQVFNTQGKLLWENQQVNASRATVSLAQLAKGIYLVSIKTRSGIATKKLMLE